MTASSGAEVCAAGVAHAVRMGCQVHAGVTDRELVCLPHADVARQTTGQLHVATVLRRMHGFQIMPADTNRNLFLN